MLLPCLYQRAIWLIVSLNFICYVLSGSAADVDNRNEMDNEKKLFIARTAVEIVVLIAYI